MVRGDSLIQRLEIHELSSVTGHLYARWCAHQSKSGGRRGIGIGERVSLVREAFRRVGFDGPVMITKRRGHGRKVARVWVGDGTINEVASQLILQQTVLGIVPAGSGNGLARELCLHGDPARALEVALNGY